MQTTATNSGQASTVHPLTPLSADEIRLAAKLAKAALASLGERIRFEIIELSEPAKPQVRRAVACPREARVNVYGAGEIGVWRLRVSLTEERVIEQEHVPTARPMIQLEEFMAIEGAVKADPRFIAACERRGIENLDRVCVDPWSAGNFGHEDEAGRHISHAFCWLRTRTNDNLYAHPIEGLNPVVDIKTLEVIRIDDRGAVAVPMGEYNYDAASASHLRGDLKPINITQPQGVSFTLDGHHLRWHEWSVRLGFNARESLTLHDLRYADRPVLYRASLSEMVVPYGSPDNAHYRKNVFDIGEYGLGKLVNPPSPLAVIA